MTSKVENKSESYKSLCFEILVDKSGDYVNFFFRSNVQELLSFFHQDQIQIRFLVEDQELVVC